MVLQYHKGNMEKFTNIGMYVLGGIVLVSQAVVGAWTRYTFVKKSELYKANGKPHYQFHDDCVREHADLEKELQCIHRELKSNGESLARIEGKLNSKGL